MPTLAFSMRMLVLCPLVPSVLWPLPALRMLPMLPSLPTLFLSPAAWGKQGARQQLPGIGGDTGHRGPQQGPISVPTLMPLVSHKIPPATDNTSVPSHLPACTTQTR